MQPNFAPVLLNILQKSNFSQHPICQLDSPGNSPVFTNLWPGGRNVESQTKSTVKVEVLPTR
jgi:hypothetical protein